MDIFWFQFYLLFDVFAYCSNIAFWMKKSLTLNHSSYDNCFLNSVLVSCDIIIDGSESELYAINLNNGFVCSTQYVEIYLNR